MNSGLMLDVEPGAHRLGHLRRAGMRHPVGRADDEAVERIARIERRALEAADERAAELRARSARTGLRAAGPMVARRQPASARRALRAGAAPSRDAPRSCRAGAARPRSTSTPVEFAGAALQQRVDVVRLHPVPQELRRKGEPQHLAVEASNSIELNQLE